LRIQLPGRAYLNLGERDLRAAQVRERQLARALSFAPDLAVVLCGGNDMLRSRFDVEAVAADVDAMVGAFRQQGADVITYGLLDITRSDLVPTAYAGPFRERLRAYDRAIGEVSARHGGMHVALGDHPAAADATTYSSDLLHASARGHAVIAAVTIRRLAQLSG
jgi:lysophospholipase L1-like esterase